MIINNENRQITFTYITGVSGDKVAISGNKVAVNSDKVAIDSGKVAINSDLFNEKSKGYINNVIARGLLNMSQSGIRKLLMRMVHKNMIIAEGDFKERKYKKK